MNNKITNSWQILSAKVLTIFLSVLLVIISVVGVYLLKDLITIFMFALLINYLLTKPVHFIYRFLKFKALIIFVALILILFFFINLGNYLYPLVLEQINILQTNLPIIESNLDHISIKFFGTNTNDLINSYMKVISEKIDYQNFSGLISGLLLSSINILTAFVITLITSFYLLLDGDKVWSLFTKLFPPNFKNHFDEIKTRIDTNLNALVLGQFKLACLTAFVMFSTYLIIGNKYAILLGSLQMLEFIPVFGTWIAIIPSVLLIAATSGTDCAMIVLTVYLIYTQIIRDHIIAPRIMGNAFGVHPLAIIFGLLIGIKIFGLIGIIVSLPLIALISACVNYLTNLGTRED
jgi:predicted PurR-regulated permease PerM